MPVPTLKQEALESLQGLPEDADIDEIMYRLYVIDKLRKSREAIIGVSENEMNKLTSTATAAVIPNS